MRSLTLSRVYFNLSVQDRSKNSQVPSLLSDIYFISHSTMISDPCHILSKYSVSPYHGFLPEKPPLHRLPQCYYQPWEVIMDILPNLISHRLVRSKVNCTPTLNTSELSSEEEWRRAYLVLSFITHAYIWGDHEPSQVF